MSVDLSQLRDIHLPEPVGWWPLAPGWWLVMAATIVVILLVMFLRRRRRLLRWRREAEAVLTQLKQRHQSHPHEAQEAKEVVEQLSVLMRRVATTRFPAEEVASLSGEAWLSFLDSQSKSGENFLQGPGRLLADAPYRSAPIQDSELEALLALCGQWITNLPGTRR